MDRKGLACRGVERLGKFRAASSDHADQHGQLRSMSVSLLFPLHQTVQLEIPR